MPTFLYFKSDELAALMDHCRRQMAHIDHGVLSDDRKRRNLDELTRHLFWDSLYVKLEQVFRHPTCCWCDSRGWDLDDPDMIPTDVPPHPHVPPTWN